MPKHYKYIPLLCVLAGYSFSDQLPEEVNTSADDDLWRVRGVPVVFKSDNMSFSYGLGGVAIGAGQPQAAIFASAFTSTNDSNLWAVGAYNYTFDWLPNVYWSADSYGWDMTEYHAYDEQYGYTVRPMDSDVDLKPIEAKNMRYRGYGRYVIPIADGARANQNLNDRNFIPERTQVVKGWNPLTSGVTSIRFGYEHSERDYEDPAEYTQTGADIWRFRLRWDNTDSWVIPNKGARFTAEYNWGDDQYSDEKWRLWTAEASGFVDIGNFKGITRQQVLAFNLWMADTPTWNDGARPPDYLGASLGGLDRLRGYDSYRFYDKSAWAYQVEYRMIPTWQPLDKIASLIKVRVPWWQFALFVDAGATNDKFDVKEFNEQLLYTGGASVRIFAEGMLFRIDYGVSKDEGMFSVMIDQPF